MEEIKKSVEIRDGYIISIFFKLLKTTHDYIIWGGYIITLCTADISIFLPKGWATHCLTALRRDFALH